MTSAVETPAWRRHFFRGLLSAAAAVILSLACMLGWLKVHEDELVFRTDISRSRALRAPPLEFGRIDIPTTDTQALAGILLTAAAAHDSGFWVLHLHGNADSAFSPEQRRNMAVLRKLGLNVLTFDYRGFGLSPGIASEAHMYEDCEAAYEYLVHSGVPQDHIILWGHSLGGGPAVLMATRRAAAALVLFGTFTSIPAAAQDMYRYVPVKWFAGIHFDSLDRIRQVHMPVLIAHSVGDRVIAFHHGEELFAAANEPKKFLALKPLVDDALGGHARALYDRPDLLAAGLSPLIGAQLQYRDASE